MSREGIYRYVKCHISAEKVIRDILASFRERAETRLDSRDKCPFGSFIEGPCSARPRREASTDLKVFAAVRAEPTISRRRFRTAMVLTGMALFVTGFLLLLAALTPSDEASLQRYADSEEVENSTGTSSPALVLVGLLMSIAGLLVATVVPTMSFLAWSRDDG